MIDFLRNLWTIASIELRQRVRGIAWYVLLAVFVLIVLIVTAVASLALQYQDDPGANLYSIIVYFVLLLSSLVTPALCGNAINGDREAGTLATTQVTLVTTPQLILGKLLAAWITSLTFLAAAVPFIAYAVIRGGVRVDTFLISLLMLAITLLVISAFGVGLSGVVRRPLFSIVVTYLLVALLSVGTLIAFGLGSLALQSRVEVTSSSVDWSKLPPGTDPYDPSTGAVDPQYCTDEYLITSTYPMSVPRPDLVWWALAANPYVALADAVPTHLKADDYPNDMFGYIKLALRQSQRAPDLGSLDWSECDPVIAGEPGPTPAQIIDSGTPGWFVGVLIEVLIAGGLIAGSLAATRTPARHLAAGSRIA